MSTCRTCLSHLLNKTKYSVDHMLDELSGQTERNGLSNTLQLRKMIEKCIPEMDLDTCDSPVICSDCFQLLISAYKFRAICIQTEEKIYQYIEKNNLRLGESIDLINLCIPIDYSDIKLENGLKQEADVFTDMHSLPQETCSLQKTNEKEYIHVINNNEPKRSSKRKLYDNENASSINIKLEYDSIPFNANGLRKRPRRKLQENNKVAAISQSDSCSEDENRSEQLTECSKYKKRPFSCDKCQYKTSKLDLLKKHIRLKCGVRLPPKFKCDKCSYKSIRQRNVIRHQMIHGGPRPFVCGHCSKGFTEKSALKYHMFKHQSDKPLPFKCQEEGCEYTCARNCDLTAHKLKHLKDSSLCCRVCNKITFTTKVKLVQHERECRSSKKNKKFFIY